MKQWMKERWTVPVHLLRRESHYGKGSFQITCACVPSESPPPLSIAPTYDCIVFCPLASISIGLNWPQFNHFALFPVGVDNTLYAQFDLLALLVPDSPTSHHRSVQYRILPTTLWRVGGCYQDSWLRRVSGFAKGTAIFLGHCSSEQ